MRAPSLFTCSLLAFATVAAAGCTGTTAESGSKDAATVKDVSTGKDVAADIAADATQASDIVGNAEAQKAILAIPQKESWALPGLSGEVQVLRTEGDIPHVYAKNRKDLAHVMGFVMARHRYFSMELASRLGLGTLSALLGDAAFKQDADSRATGSVHVADGILSRLTPEQADLFDGFAAGVNDYIDQVIATKLPQPSEIAIAKLFMSDRKVAPSLCMSMKISPRRPSA